MKHLFSVAAALFAFAVFPTSATADLLNAVRVQHWIEYGALPARELHTARLGDVVDIQRMQTSHSNAETRCLPNLKNYKINRYTYTYYGPMETMELLDLDAAFGIKGRVLKGKLAAAGIRLAAGYETHAKLVFDPLSLWRPKPAEAVLYEVNSDKEDCAPWLRILNGDHRGQIIVAKVYHGREHIESSLQLEGGAGASADYNLIKRMIADATLEISADGRYLIMQKSTMQNGEATLAIQPLGLNWQELAGITAFMQGDTGLTLERKLRDVYNKPGVNPISAFSLWLRDNVGIPYFGESYNCRSWVEKFFTGKEGDLVSYDVLVNEFKEKIEMQDVAAFAAAFALTCEE